MLGNNTIARIFEHCGLMTDLGLIFRFIPDGKIGQFNFPRFTKCLVVSFFLFNASNDGKFRKDFHCFCILLRIRHLHKNTLVIFSFSHSQHVKIKP